MPPRRSPHFGTAGHLLSLMGLAVLPLAPEIYLYFRSHGGVKYFAPIGYYECIVSFLLLAPALLANRAWSRFWVSAVGTVMALATLVLGFQALATQASTVRSQDELLLIRLRGETTSCWRDGAILQQRALGAPPTADACPTQQAA